MVEIINIHKQNLIQDEFIEVFEEGLENLKNNEFEIAEESDLFKDLE